MTDQTLHLENAPKDIAVQWFLRGRKESDALLRFTAYWLSFNQLYDYGCTNLEREDDAVKITRYCKDNLDILEQTIDFEAAFLEPFKERPVATGTERGAGINWRAGNMNRIVMKLAEALAEGDIPELPPERLRWIASDYINVSQDAVPLSYRLVSLFTSMYRLRCNLYHGLQNTSGRQDLELVESACAVFERCLPALLTRTFGLSK